MSNSLNRLNQQWHRVNVHSTVGPTDGRTMQMRSPYQPIESMSDAADDFIFIVCVDSLIGTLIAI